LLFSPPEARNWAAQADAEAVAAEAAAAAHKCKYIYIVELDERVTTITDITIRLS